MNRTNKNPDNSRPQKIQLLLESGQGGKPHFQLSLFPPEVDIACSDLRNVALWTRLGVHSYLDGWDLARCV